MLVTLSLLSLFLCALATFLFYIGIKGKQPASVQKKAICCLAVSFILLSFLLCVGAIRDMDIYVLRSWYLIPLAWSLLLIAFIIYYKLRYTTIFVFVAPLCFILLLSALIFLHQEKPMDNLVVGPVLVVHLSLVFAGIGIMGVAAGAGCLFLWQENLLKNKTKLMNLPKNIPSLGALDKVNHIATRFGFPLYAIGLIFGFIWAYMAWGRLFSFDPKEIISLLILALYGFLFYEREVRGTNGRKTAKLALIVFAVAMFSIFVVNTFLPTHHSF